ncbi:MAG TPA: LOG family protein, partial [Deferrisomatales bacterium]|nr:LOG family protein [Deferrisomatales bacterium]
GFGTLDELTDTLTLVQTGKIAPVPVILFGKEFWDRVIRFDALAEEGMIAERDLDLIRFVDTAEEAAAIVSTSLGDPAAPTGS